MPSWSTETCRIKDSVSLGTVGQSTGNADIPLECRSQPFGKPNFCLQVITKPLKKLNISVRNVFRRHIPCKTIRSTSLEESKSITTKLVTELQRISKCQSHLTTSHGEEYSLVECQQFILQWAKELSTLPMTSGERNKSSPKLQSACWEEYEVEKTMSPEDAERRLSESQRVVENWAAQLESRPKGSVCPSEDVCSVLRDLERQWKTGKLPSMLPAMDFIIWSVLQEHPDQGTIPEIWLKSKQSFKHSASITVIPELVWDWICEAAVDILLDPKSANPSVLISVDRKRMRVGEKKECQEYGHHSACPSYNGWFCALGTEGFTTGRRYWEVGVEGKRDWRIGVARESAPRNGYIDLNTTTGYWTLRMQITGLKALKVPAVDIRNPGDLSRIGVYLDVEQGQLSFYDAVRRSHIYTFNDTFPEKLYPVFGTVETDLDLIIHKVP